jgi:uncharacterized lipoprotein NlpE involved in copper resistance
MKHTTLALRLATLALSLATLGCANQDKPTYTAPSVVAVKTSVEKVRQYVRPEGQTAVKELSDAITTYQKQVDDQSLALVKAQEEAVYWNAKQVKALKELWLWRGIALFSIVCVVGYVGIKTSWKFLV